MRLPSSLLALAALAAPVLLQAANPHIIIQGDPPDPTIIVSNDFTFGADNLGGGVFSFQNESGLNWVELSISATLPSLSEQITVGPGPFDTDTVRITPSNGAYLYTILFGPTATGGVPNGGLFSINLNDSGDDPNGSGSWGPGADFSAKANATPEPSPKLLFAGGLLVLVGLFRFRRKRAASDGTVS